MPSESSNWWDATKPFVEILGVLLLLAHTIFTIKMYYVNKGAADAAANAANTAKETLILDQRPWVGLMGGSHVSAEIVKGSPITVTLEVQNVGKTPALEERGIGYLANRPINTPMPNFSGCSRNGASSPVILMPSANAQIRITTDAPGSAGTPAVLTEKDIDLIDSEQTQLFAYGCFWYKDAFSKEHETDYCLHYVPASRKGGSANTFEACPTHNYAD